MGLAACAMFTLPIAVFVEEFVRHCRVTRAKVFVLTKENHKSAFSAAVTCELRESSRGNRVEGIELRNSRFMFPVFLFVPYELQRFLNTTYTESSCGNRVEAFRRALLARRVGCHVMSCRF